MRGRVAGGARRWTSHSLRDAADEIHAGAQDRRSSGTGVQQLAEKRAAQLRALAPQRGAAQARFAADRRHRLDPDAHEFVDLENRAIKSIFKLYPWEWMVHEEFGAHALDTYKRVQWIEPIWKMLLSNKGILPILWELFPHHANLLECYFTGPKQLTDYVKKPLLSREGANLSIHRGAAVEETGGPYGEEGFVFQATARIAEFGGAYPIIGSWMIDGIAAGIGIRESATPVTNNLSCFVPHLFE